MLAIGSMNAEFYRAIGISAENIFRVPYAVDNLWFQQAQRFVCVHREKLRESLGLAPGRPVILYASKLSSRKRPFDLLAAYKLLSADGVSAPYPYLLYVGDGEMRESLHNAVKALPWDTIRILGFKNQSELPAFYDLCDVFVLPSLAEPWGLVINEVLNFSKPVVVSDQVGCARDLVRHGESGYIFQGADVQGLCKALKALCTSPQLRQRLGDRGFEIISRWGYDEDERGVLEAVRALGIPSNRRTS
jgi:glycosyltransferase involved in cell wall biosynthesis